MKKALNIIASPVFFFAAIGPIYRLYQSVFESEQYRIYLMERTQASNIINEVTSLILVLICAFAFYKVKIVRY